ncbi:MAG: helix-turn-helix domain-containing protein [Lachnospiraceae bacterium]|nr:helix-turn-helix domain-containing protein [Lachnospiraceae bacterium]
MKLKEIRAEKGLSFRELAELSGVPQRTIEDIEYLNKDTTKVCNIVALCKALNVSMDEMCADLFE